MDFRDAWLRMKRTDRVELATKVGTSYLYLQKIAGGFATPSLAMAQRIGEALGKKLDMGGYLRQRELAGKRRAG